MEAIEKADAPPPDGSTARKTWCVFFSGSRIENSSLGHFRASIDWMSALENAFSLPSALIPRDSRNLRKAQRRHQIKQHSKKRVFELTGVTAWQDLRRAACAQSRPLRTTATEAWTRACDGSARGLATAKN